MLRVTTGDVEKLYRALKDLDGVRGLPYAARESLNTSAFAARREWAHEGRRQMIVRQGNKGKATAGWTFGARNHRVVKARLKKNVQQMESVSGNKLRYMAEQEHGVRKVRAKGLQIPEEQSRINEDKRRLVGRQYWRKAIGAKMGKRYNRKSAGFGNSGRRYAAGTIRQARAQGKRFIYLKYSSRHQGIYDLRRLKGGLDLKNALVWDMSRRTTYTRPHPMLRQTIKTLKPYFPQYHRAALEKQIRFVLRKRGVPYQGPPAGLIGAAARFGKQR